jgi:hypothetical protein
MNGKTGEPVPVWGTVLEVGSPWRLVSVVSFLR